MARVRAKQRPVCALCGPRAALFVVCAAAAMRDPPRGRLTVLGFGCPLRKLAARLLAPKWARGLRELDGPNRMVSRWPLAANLAAPAAAAPAFDCTNTPRAVRSISAPSERPTKALFLLLLFAACELQRTSSGLASKVVVAARPSALARHPQASLPATNWS